VDHIVYNSVHTKYSEMVNVESKKASERLPRARRRD
jgi:hypothetical protein